MHYEEGGKKERRKKKSAGTEQKQISYEYYTIQFIK